MGAAQTSAEPCSEGGGRLHPSPAPREGPAAPRAGGRNYVRLFGKNDKSQATTASGGGRGGEHGRERVPVGGCRALGRWAGLGCLSHFTNNH